MSKIISQRARSTDPPKNDRGISQHDDDAVPLSSSHPSTATRESESESESGRFGRVLARMAHAPAVPIASFPSRIGEQIGRFRLVARLGKGGMGVVYKALDAERGEPVALKMLRRMNARSLSLFKREFRAAAGVHHPNLVKHLELFAINGDWFFTMELVVGARFLDYVRGETQGAPGPLDALGLLRLRGALRGLVRGVRELHARGAIHRDLKPGNVLVTSEGRAVVLDFGLSTWAPPAHLDAENEGGGTPLYMAPEQIDAPSVTPACDWYAVGVILYEALTGRAPFEGSIDEIFGAKRGGPPPPPSSIAPDIPPDLDALCLELLQREPSRRPSSASIWARLGGEDDAVRAPEAPPPRLASGARTSASRARAACYQALEEAFRAVASEGPVRVDLAGPASADISGVVRLFLDTLEKSGSALIFRARCYPREHVPYKALDGLVDALAVFLRRLRLDKAAALLPEGFEDLAETFPVLQGVPAVTDGPNAGAPSDDPETATTRAFSALRGTLTRIAANSIVTIWIDGVSYDDHQSAEALRGLLPTHLCAVLLILT